MQTSLNPLLMSPMAQRRTCACCACLLSRPPRLLEFGACVGFADPWDLGSCLVEHMTHQLLVGNLQQPPLPPPRPLRDADVESDLYAARHKAAEQQIQNKKLFSDIAISAFRCDNRCSQRLLQSGLGQVSAKKLCYIHNVGFTC